MGFNFLEVVRNYDLLPIAGNIWRGNFDSRELVAQQVGLLVSLLHKFNLRSRGHLTPLGSASGVHCLTVNHSYVFYSTLVFYYIYV